MRRVLLSIWVVFASFAASAVMTQMTPAAEEKEALALAVQITKQAGLDRSEDVILLADEVERRFGESENPSLREVVVFSLYSKGLSLGKLGKPEAALSLFDEIDRRYAGDADPKVRFRIAGVLLAKGILQGNRGLFVSVVAVCDEIDRRFGKETTLEMRQLTSHGLSMKAAALDIMGRPYDAISISEEMGRRFADDQDPSVREMLARAFVYKAEQLFRLGRLDAAQATHDEIIRKFGADTNPRIKELVASARYMTNARDSGRTATEGAVKMMTELDGVVSTNSSPSVRALAVRNLINKARYQGDLGKVDDELSVHDEIVKRFGRDVAPVVREQVVQALAAKAARLRSLGKNQEAMAAVEYVLENFGADKERDTRRKVALVLNERAVINILTAKQKWSVVGVRQELLESGISDLRQARAMREAAPMPEFEANLAYVLFLSGDAESAIQPLRVALNIVDVFQLRRTQNLVTTNRVEPEDSAYERFVERIWSEAHPGR